MEDVERDLLHYFNNSMLGQFYQFLNVVRRWINVDAEGV